MRPTMRIAAAARTTFSACLSAQQGAPPGEPPKVEPAHQPPAIAKVGRDAFIASIGASRCLPSPSVLTC